jgi:mRNA interferase RelE/StbE
VARFRVLIKASAGKELEAVGTRKDRARLVERIRTLGSDPRSVGCEKLSGSVELYRVRVGSCRVVYESDDASAEIHVVKIGHRRDVYR